MVDNSERSIALVVEDDPWIRLLLRDLLTDAGYAVLEASNGSAALRLAQRQPPALVLLDLVLPEQSGLELLTELKSTRATAHVPVIAVSARTDLLARAAELADAVVAKPFDIEELLARISAARRRSCPGANVPTVHRFGADLSTRCQPRRSCKSGPFVRHLDPTANGGRVSATGGSALPRDRLGDGNRCEGVAVGRSRNSSTAPSSAKLLSGPVRDVGCGSCAAAVVARSRL